MRYAEVARELANSESGPAHLRHLGHRRTALSAAWRPEPNARRAEASAHRRRRYPEARRDAIRAHAGAVGSFQVGVRDRLADLRSRQPGSLGRGKAGWVEQVGTGLGRPTDGFRGWPPRDRRVISRKQHCRDATALMLHRPGVVRTLQETLGVRLVSERCRLDDARDEASHRIDHDHRRQLAPGQDEVADRKLLIDVAFDDTLVDAFVMPADDHEMRHLREAVVGDLIEQRALYGHEDDVPAIRLRRPDGARERLGFQHHPGAAAVGRVVDYVMAVGRPFADVMHRELDLARGPRARDDALCERALEHLREEREYVDPRRHSRTSCGTTTIRPPATSISRTTDAIAGRSSSSREPSARTMSTSVSPARITSLTVPSDRPSGVSARRPRRSAQRCAPFAARRASARDTRSVRPRIRSASVRVL